MDLGELASKFTASDEGRKAFAALEDKGIGRDVAEGYLAHAVTAVGQHAEDHAQSHGILGDHPGRTFFAAFASGLVKGDGIWGALEDGAAGVVTGRVVEALCDKTGMDSQTAEVVAAAAVPYALSFIKSHVGG